MIIFIRLIYKKQPSALYDTSAMRQAHGASILQPVWMLSAFIGEKPGLLVKSREDKYEKEDTRYGGIFGINIKTQLKNSCP
jgi:hypothetical protein